MFISYDIDTQWNIPTSVMPIADRERLIHEALDAIASQTTDDAFEAQLESLKAAGDPLLNGDVSWIDQDGE